MVCVYTAVLVAVAVLFRFYPKQDDSFVLTLGTHSAEAGQVHFVFFFSCCRFFRLKNGRAPETSHVLYCALKVAFLLTFCVWITQVWLLLSRWGCCSLCHREKAGTDRGSGTVLVTEGDLCQWASLCQITCTVVSLPVTRVPTPGHRDPRYRLVQDQQCRQSVTSLDRLVFYWRRSTRSKHRFPAPMS